MMATAVVITDLILSLDSFALVEVSIYCLNRAATICYLVVYLELVMAIHVVWCVYMCCHSIHVVHPCDVLSPTFVD